LEGPAAEHLRRHLPGDREHRRAIDLRVVEAGEQIGGAGPGDGETRGGTPGELAVGRRRERGGALVADTDEREVAGILLAAQRVGEPEVGVTDHAEHVRDPPRHHRLHHHVGHRARVRFVGRQAHVHAVVAYLDREARRRVSEAGRRRSGERVVVVPVPGATEPAVLDGALPERSALVGAAVVEGAERLAHVGEHDGPPAERDRAHPTLGERGGVGHEVPDEFVGGAHAGSSPP